MNTRITLVSTCHREHGLADSNGLYRMIKKIAPEVIFFLEEIPTSKFNGLYEKSPDSLETKTIKKYLEKHPIEHFSVDTNVLLEVSLRNDINEFFNLLIDDCIQYKWTLLEHSYSIPTGFKYLNSKDCIKLLDYLLSLEKENLDIFKDKKWYRIYKMWLDFNNQQRNEVIKNIYSYCELNNYNTALFLVRAEHRKAIINKIPKFEKENRLKLNWTFKSMICPK